MAKLKLLWYWQTMGPYHFARMRALAAITDWDVSVVECTCRDDHAWSRREDPDFELITLSSEELSDEVLKKTQKSYSDVLVMKKPDVIVVAGYSQAKCLAPVLAYRKRFASTLVVLWSESTIRDGPRLRIKEAFKTLAMPVFDGALVAGVPHAEYLRHLQMPAEDIKIVGNCVDNDFFSTKAKELRLNGQSSVCGLPSQFFLYVGRMIPVKNLQTLLCSYHEYRRRAGSLAWDIVLAGGGPEEANLRALVASAGIAGVHFTGVRQLDDLLTYYAHAKCLVLPSISEPWGLVVNEAMASGLPVIASERCGCVRDLIRHGVNGFLFDPYNDKALTETLLKISDGSVPLDKFGMKGQELISKYTPSLFAARAFAHLTYLQQRRGQSPNVNYGRSNLRRRLGEYAYNVLGASSGVI